MEVNRRRYPAVGNSVRKSDKSDEVIMSIHAAIVLAAKREGLKVSEVLNRLIPEHFRQDEASIRKCVEERFKNMSPEQIKAYNDSVVFKNWDKK